MANRSANKSIDRKSDDNVLSDRMNELKSLLDRFVDQSKYNL